jgi:hypothetical protein
MLAFLFLVVVPSVVTFYFYLTGYSFCGWHFFATSDLLVKMILSPLQGGAVNCGLKWFFSMYRPSCLIEAHVWPEKYLLVWAGPLTKHLFNFNFIFLSDGLTAAAERASCFVDLYRS